MPGSCAPQNARIKIQFNGVGGLRTYIKLHAHRATNCAEHERPRSNKNRRGDLIPVIVTVIVAVVGTAGILNNLRPGNDLQDSGNARMITSAAVSRVGAIEIPSEPLAGRRQRESRHEKSFPFFASPFALALSTTAAFARGGMGGAHGMGSSRMSMMGGAFGTTAAAPGTNSSGTALSSDGVGRPMLDTKPAIRP